jgi:hypothetical protein
MMCDERALQEKGMRVERVYDLNDIPRIELMGLSQVQIRILSRFAKKMYRFAHSA